ncbi:hypothetical protein IX83_05255 [Basilea psittacipulmonis DSM 24701]|uniref:PIN domain-containing protein n=2 Tax=Basilea TaxID=1472344 RepID=A0A077DI36_9BURK|nr:hypothetical protein IX83_05255 [Basilea psittacipulmonis DSM 24701]
MASKHKKLYVLDTNVLLHDSSCLFKFKEHDVFIPMITLEELDHHKTGNKDIARTAREVSRTLAKLCEHSSIDKVTQGIALNTIGHSDALGLLFFQTQALQADLSHILPHHTKPDNTILSVVKCLNDTEKREVILVSKDINMRIKALALGLKAEDYRNDLSPLMDEDFLYTGKYQLEDPITPYIKREYHQNGKTYLELEGPFEHIYPNQLCYNQDIEAISKSITPNGIILEKLRAYTKQAKAHVWGIYAKNREQNFALNILMNPDIHLVTILGSAGTGKTLLTLAAGIAQVLETHTYKQIIVTRATVSMGEDIGFLPGTEEEKMYPWMGALEDNLDFLYKNTKNHLSISESSKQEIQAHIQFKSMSFMRGRTFTDTFIIIDEAQNLTPKQMKALITRAGHNTKVVCLGNIAQIDTPYLTEGSSGITHIVERFKEWDKASHIILTKAERSELAEYAEQYL